MFDVSLAGMYKLRIVIMTVAPKGVISNVDTNCKICQSGQKKN